MRPCLDEFFDCSRPFETTGGFTGTMKRMFDRLSWTKVEAPTHTCLVDRFRFLHISHNLAECTSLNWCDSGLGNGVGIRLAKALEGNQRLVVVQLSGNRFSPAVLRELVNQLRGVQSLEVVKVLPLRSSDEIDVDLLTTVREFEQAVVDRSWCQIHADLLTRVSHSDPKLCEIDCSNSQLGDGMAHKLAEALHANRTLQCLHLSGNNFTATGIASLAGILGNLRLDFLVYSF